MRHDIRDCKLMMYLMHIISKDVVSCAGVAGLPDVVVGACKLVILLCSLLARHLVRALEYIRVELDLLARVLLQLQEDSIVSTPAVNLQLR